MMSMLIFLIVVIISQEMLISKHDAAYKEYIFILQLYLNKAK